MSEYKWFPCCGGASPPCVHCSTDDSTVTATFGNITDDNCAACDTFNASWVLDRDDINMCVWEKYGVLNCGGSTGTLSYRIVAWVTFDADAHKIWWCNLLYYHSSWMLYWPAEKYTFKYDSGSSSTMDCTATQTLTFISYQSPFWPTYDYRQCYYSGTPTCQLN
jgi:hypothetical protein